MALARVQYESDGSTTVYSIPFPYINRDDIKVSIDGTETNDFVFLDGSTINLDAAPSQGLIVDVLRETERNDLLVEFNDGSTLLETDLTLAAQQSFFTAQEAFDQALSTLNVTNDGTYSASTRRISLLGYPLNFEDAANKQYVDNIFAQGEDAYEQATIADNAATTAAGARDAAQLAEATTLNYRNTTEEYKNLASQSAGAANTSETNAASSATAAQLSEDDVAANAAAAQLAETNAQSHRAAAQNSETAAAGSANNANNSETAASNSEAKAAQWADWGEDQTVEPGKYSAKHHSIKASDSATSASNDANAASSSANAASISEDNASSSELAASTSEANASDAETAASTSEANASDAETDAVTAKDASIQAKNDAQALYGDLAAVDAAKTNAVQAASTATSAADVAQESARLAAAFYPSVTLALQETVSGQYFQIAENGYVQLYLNDAGAAKPLLKMASQESLDALNARPDPLLTSLLF